jgi:AcrR family transcriptional regulator
VGADVHVRPLRADAQRNRDAILRAAREVFDQEGALASLDGVALRAGVGSATLYRNFPTRDELLAAVMYEGTTAQLVVGDELSDTLRPVEALREWMQQLAWQIRVWRDLPECVAAALTKSVCPLRSVTIPLLHRTAALLQAAQAEDAMADGVTADEIFELVTTLSWAIDRFNDDQARARHRVARATVGLFR